MLIITLPVMALTSVNQTAVEYHGPLTVKGNQIVDNQGRPASLAGPSLFWGNKGWASKGEIAPDEYYNANVVEYVQKSWNASIVRIAMGAESRGGYLEDPRGRMQKIEAVADAAIEQGMYFIVDWHSHKAEQNTEQAIAFFKHIAQKYGHTDNLIYEIYNEPLDHTDWDSVIKPYAENVIAAIRTIDKDNLIIVGTQTWSQDVDKAADSPIQGFNNIAYTLHFYAGTHKQELRDKATYALNKGIALMVTEWGTVNADGDGGPDAAETQRWMDFMRANNLSHCNWSLHSKKEGASILTENSDPNGDWTEENFTQSGNIVKKIISGWHKVDYAGGSKSSSVTEK
ncbi:glycoside hydrolase family 5 protein [Paraglaciecola aquimarina]|uniref:Glycoside hydrolase family 5 protein n=1 Tax=Paraglaciecola algarum TaxID=3050085 RepID=A0ABS9D475_9ALTE|nr:glycoside hydrolase family 5 protein [Paraglaciecola sp. G1-23]MCF2947720.1 glycoside hydrolase family 5 protein [Paraglaciecola sp. G1-23]